MLALLLFACLQTEPPPPVAIRGATVVTEPGRQIENATVVLRGGLVEAVGDVPVPPDAKVLDGKGLFVYAGFVDAHGRWSMPDTKLTAEQLRAREGPAPDFTREPLFGMQDANRRGLRPDLDASTLVVPAEAEWKKWHSAGFAFAVSAAGDEYLSGTSAVLSLNGLPRRDAVVLARWGMHASFRAGGEGYPRTIMGALAHLRQFLLDARAYRVRWDDYRSAPRGKARPPWDAALEAAQPLLDGRMPLVFEADTENEILRALALADEFGLKSVISGGGESWKVADRLGKVPVLLSVKLPKEPKARKNDDRPKRVIEEEKRLWEERASCAARLAQAKVPFAFSTSGGAPGDLLENLPKMMSHGLTRDQALEALTKSAASILGFEEFGTIEKGRIASLTVLTAPLGDRKSKVRFVIADGRCFEFDVKKAGGAPPEVNLTGKWAVTVEALKLEAVMTLEQQKEGDLTGKLVADHGEADVTGSVSGKKFKLSGRFHGSEFTLDGEWKDGTLTGKVKSPMGDADFTARPEGKND